VPADQSGPYLRRRAGGGRHPLRSPSAAYAVPSARPS